MLSCLYTVFSIFGLCIAQIPNDWRSYIDKDILERDMGRSYQTSFEKDHFQGDMKGISQKNGDEDDGLSDEGNVIDDAQYLWTGGRVPYTISPVFPPMEKRRIKNAMKAISEQTSNCVTFVERKKEIDHVRFMRGFGCNSNVGKQGGAQDISLARGCLEHYGSIQHEILHALGFHHEMSREDRDDHILINWKNIRKGEEKQFEKKPGNTFGLPYDYKSVMHYPYNAFAEDSKSPTMVPKVKHAKIGQNKNLSDLDAIRIQKAYKCTLSDVTKPTVAETTEEPEVTERRKLTIKKGTLPATTSEIETTDEPEVTQRRKLTTKKRTLPTTTSEIETTEEPEVTERRNSTRRRTLPTRTSEKESICINERDRHQISCAPKLISIQSAFYGTTCGGSKCAGVKATLHIQDKCNNRESCWIDVLTIYLTDPCERIEKNLAVNYSCYFADNKPEWVPESPKDSLMPGDALKPGRLILSSGQKIYLILQADGNLVLRRTLNDEFIWGSSTSLWPEQIKEFAMQTDGNMVLYDQKSQPIWNSFTAGRQGARLTIKDDESMTLTKADLTFWGFWNNGRKISCQQNGEGMLRSGQELIPGSSISSSTGGVSLKLMDNELALIRKSDGGTLWGLTAWRWNKNISKLVMMADGNLVLFSGDQRLWESDTHHSGADLVFQNDGNLYIRKGDLYYWGYYAFGKNLNLDTVFSVFASEDDIVRKNDSCK